MSMNVNFKGGGSVVKRKPVFSRDGENVFVSWKNSILEYSTKTGKLLYEYKGSTDQIVGFGYHTYESFDCIIACSTSGQIHIWKTITHFKLYEKKIKKRIKDFFIITSTDTELTALISYINQDGLQFAIADIKSNTINDIKLNINFDYYRIDIGGENTYMAVIQQNYLYFVLLKNPDNVYRSYINMKRKFKCIACHPYEQAILTGDTTGRTIIWQNMIDRKPTQTVFHWHTLPVKCVTFSTSGSYFYSGGKECVLVKWNVNNIDDRRFLPRIPATIEQISVSSNNLFVAVSTRDNAIRILDTRMNQISLIQHLVIGEQFSTGIVYDPRTRSLIMNGNVGHIQFYSPLDKTLMYNLDIVGQNKITSERGLSLKNIEVKKVAISKCGFWLATVEERIENCLHDEIRLKFWKFDDEKQKFELNTSIEYPHENAVTNLLFQPIKNNTNLKCVTVSKDKKFKVWQLVDHSTVYRTGVAWKCYGIGFYRDLPCTGLSFSIDGSLMSTGFGSIVTVWLPDTCDLKCSLLHPDYREDITFVEFGKASDCHLLVATSSNHINVWSLLSLSLIWTVSINVTLLVADTMTTQMAVVCKKRKVIVFKPGSSAALYKSKKLNYIVTAGFVPNKYWSEKSSLYFIDDRNELFCLSNEEDIDSSYNDKIEPSEESLFNKMQPSKQTIKPSLQPTKHLFEKDRNHKDIKSYLDVPAHTMAPVRFMCKLLLSSLVLQKDSVPENDI